MKAAYCFFVNACKFIGQIASALLEKLDELDRRRAYAKRRRIASYMAPPRYQRRWIRAGVSGRQLYFLGLVKRRAYRIQDLRRCATFGVVGLSTCLLGPPISELFRMLGKFPTIPHWMKLAIGVISVMTALAALVERCKANSRANRGGELALLVLDTVSRVRILFGSDQFSESGLAPGGSRYSFPLEKVRRIIKADCWKITLWTADLTGRPRSEFASESVSSFPRILLWATNIPSREKMRLLDSCALRFVSMIDSCKFDFEFAEASDTDRQIPQMKRPSLVLRIRNSLSFRNVSTAIAVAAGIATILTYFKVPPAILNL